MKPGTVLKSILVMLMAFTAIVAQDNQAPTGDPEIDKVEAMIREAWQEHRGYIDKGGKATDTANPARKWIETLWEYGRKNAATEAATRATGEALHLMVHSGLSEEMQRRADTLNPNDPAWNQVISVLRESADESGNYDYLLDKAKSLVRRSSDREIKARAQLAVGQVYWQKKDIDQGKAAFQAVIKDYPNTSFARDAEGSINEMDLLNLGQQAPMFTNKTTKGERLALWDFKGKVVLLDFWASWCSICVKEIPALKALRSKYKDLVIIGISLDDDAKALDDMVAERGINWPQLRDGRDGSIARLFNVKGTPTYYVLDRNGRIAAKNIPAKGLEEAIAKLIEK